MRLIKCSSRERISSSGSPDRLCSEVLRFGVLSSTLRLSTLRPFLSSPSVWLLRFFLMMLAERIRKSFGGGRLRHWVISSESLPVDSPTPAGAVNRRKSGRTIDQNLIFCELFVSIRFGALNGNGFRFGNRPASSRIPKFSKLFAVSILFGRNVKMVCKPGKSQIRRLQERTSGFRTSHKQVRNSKSTNKPIRGAPAICERQSAGVG